MLFSTITSAIKIFTQRIPYVVCALAVAVVFVFIGAYKFSLYRGEKIRVKCLKLRFKELDALDSRGRAWIANNGPELFGMPKRDNETFEEYKKRLSEYIKKY